MALRKTSVVDRGLHSTANRSGESFGLIEASTNASIWLFAPMEACLITRGANSGSPGRNRSQACLGTWADSYGSQRILDNHTTEVPANSGRRVRGLAIGLTTGPLSAPALGSQFIADAFADDFSFELGKRKQDVERQSAHRMGRVEVLNRFRVK